MRSHEPKRNRNSNLNVALYKEEMERLKREQLNSTCRNLSEYCRKLLLCKPVIVFYRSRSFDAFITEAIALRKELQTVRQGLLFTREGEQRMMLLTEEIKQCINKIFDHVCQNRKDAESQ